MLAGVDPVSITVLAVIITRRGRSLAGLSAATLLVWLNLWWFLSLVNVQFPPGTYPFVLSVPRSTPVMIGGHLAVVALFLIAVGILSPRKGSPLDLAHRSARRGDHLAAGEFWLQAGRTRKAYRAFLRAQAWGRAADIARTRGQIATAAKLLEREGGAALLNAAQLFARAGNEPAARRVFQRYAQHAVQSGQPEAAIDPFLRSGDARRAAHAVEMALSQRRLSSAHGELALRAAREARRLPLAAQVAMACRKYREAGDLFLAAESPLEAARAFEQAGEPLRAAEALRLAGRTDSAAKMRARQLIDTGQFALAADEFEAAGLIVEAAQALERLGKFDEAIEKYRKAGRLREAADLCRRHGDPREAAELFAELHDWGEAATAWERAGDAAQAARCFEKAGDYERALDLLARDGLVEEQAALLARVDRPDDGFRLLFRRGDLRAAWELLAGRGGAFPALADELQQLAAWLAAQGETTAAISAIQRATSGQTVTRDLLQAHYALAELLEQHGDLPAAEAQWRRIVDFDYAYRDSAKRLNAVRDRRASRQGEGGSGSAADGARSTGDEAAARYVLKQELGRGGMGIVYRAHDTRLGRTVAIKVLDSRQLTPEALRRFEREARAAAALSHPGIVHIYDFDKGFSSYYISMEYVPGQTLSQLLRDDVDFVRRNLLSLMRQICDAVAYAHSHNVVHRDLKPANMVYAEQRQMKILDFGIARRLDDNEITGTGVTGTPFYMSPEQIVGETPDERSDVYSLGVTFFQMATGSVPFSSGNILRAHLEQAPPDPRTLVPDLGEGVSKLILSCLAKEPDGRPRDGRALVAAVAGLYGGGFR